VFDTNTLLYFWSVQYDEQPYESHISYLFVSGSVFCAVQAENEAKNIAQPGTTTLRDKINMWVDA